MDITKEEAKSIDASISKIFIPRVNTGVAHKDPGVGQVGAGVASAPMSLFEDALVAFAEKYNI